LRRSRTIRICKKYRFGNEPKRSRLGNPRNEDLQTCARQARILYFHTVVLPAQRIPPSKTTTSRAARIAYLPPDKIECAAFE
jgi:hypothetical protein